MKTLFYSKTLIFALESTIRYRVPAMTTKYQIVLNTCPDAESAKHIAASLVEQQLAACVNIVPGLQSIYSWQGKIKCSEEQLLIIKSSESCYQQLEQTILSLHPYELPEVVTVPINNGLPAYLNWLGDNLKH